MSLTDPTTVAQPPHPDGDELSPAPAPTTDLPGVLDDSVSHPSLFAETGPAFNVGATDKALDLPTVDEAEEADEAIVQPITPEPAPEPDIFDPDAHPDVDEYIEDLTTRPLPEPADTATVELTPAPAEPVAFVSPGVPAEPAIVADVVATEKRGWFGWGKPRQPKPKKFFTLIDPNRLWVMVVAIVLLAGILAGSLGSSFTSVYAMAAWIGLPPGVQWLPVVILDVAIVGYSWALLVFSSRAADGRPTVFDGMPLLPGKMPTKAELKQAKRLFRASRERTWDTRMLLTIVTLMSVVANFMHTWDFWGGDLTSPQSMVGALFSASIPLWALAATEQLIRLVFVRRKRIYGGDAE